PCSDNVFIGFILRAEPVRFCGSIIEYLNQGIGKRPTQNIQSTLTPCRYIDPEPTGWKIGTHERLFDCPILCVKILPIFD
ncbi:hypothetical protein, partial [Duncaniella sp.]